MSALLKLRGIAKSFEAQQVLRPISLEVGEGKRICILGPSGCGKSTLLQIVAGLLPPDGGEIELAGISVEGRGRHVPPEKRPVNMVFQDYALWPHMTARQNIEYGMKRRRTPRGQMEERLRRLAALLKLEGLLDRLPAQLSGGQQQRVGIARALATEPKLLLMDEPLSNLDVKLRTDMRGELARLLGELSIATLYVTHDRMEAFAIADRILVLRGGGIDQLGRPEELFERPASPWVAQLMGYHNRLNVAFDGRTRSVAVIAGQRVSGQRMSPGEGAGEAPAGVMLLHPDDLAVCAPDHLTADGGNRLRVTVTQAIYEGTQWRLIVRLRDGQTLHLFHGGRVEPGSELAVYAPPERAMLYDAVPAF